MQKNKNCVVFITGAGGFIGSHVTMAFVDKGYDVHVLLKSTKNIWRLTNYISKITLHVADLTDYLSLKKIINNIKPTYIIHFATHGAYPAQNEIEDIVKTNILGTTNLLQATKDIPYACFINTGSSSEYGIKNRPMKETDYCNPMSYYGITKLAATQLCQFFALHNKKPIVTLRLFSVYGPLEEPTRFIPTIIKNLIFGKPIQLTPGKQRRDFVYIKDVVRAYFAALKSKKNTMGEIINIGTGKEHTNDEIVHQLFNSTKKTVPIEKGKYPKRLWDTSHWVADITKAKKLLAWEPTYTPSSGLKRTYLWNKKI